MTTEMHPLTKAFFDGADAYRTGQPESINPHTNEELKYQWMRGYRNTRKHDRFNQTIAARQAAKIMKGQNSP